jgi:ribosomal-protein-alanine N-acetyltransferase
VFALRVDTPSDAVKQNPGVDIRPAYETDRLPLALLFAAVAEERDGIGAEPPVDVEQRAARFDLDRTFVADDGGRIVGVLFLHENELGMMVAADRRGQGVGTALVAAAIEWARAHGLLELTLGVFPHNEAAIALYRKFGFVEERRLVEHFQRRNGERWDLIEMRLAL